MIFLSIGQLPWSHYTNLVDFKPHASTIMWHIPNSLRLIWIRKELRISKMRILHRMNFQKKSICYHARCRPICKIWREPLHVIQFSCLPLLIKKDILNGKRTFETWWVSKRKGTLKQRAACCYLSATRFPFYQQKESAISHLNLNLSNKYPKITHRITLHRILVSPFF